MSLVVFVLSIKMLVHKIIGLFGWRPGRQKDVCQTSSRTLGALLGPGSFGQEQTEQALHNTGKIVAAYGLIFN